MAQQQSDPSANVEFANLIIFNLFPLDFVHLDLKTANIVKMSGNEIYLKIIDFGSAIKLENGQAKEIKKRLTITPQFVAPEIEMANKENEVLVCILK